MSSATAGYVSLSSATAGYVSFSAVEVRPNDNFPPSVVQPFPTGFAQKPCFPISMVTDRERCLEKGRSESDKENDVSKLAQQFEAQKGHFESGLGLCVLESFTRFSSSDWSSWKKVGACVDPVSELLEKSAWNSWDLNVRSLALNFLANIDGSNLSMEAYSQTFSMLVSLRTQNLDVSNLRTKFRFIYSGKSLWKSPSVLLPRQGKLKMQSLVDDLFRSRCLKKMTYSEATACFVVLGALSPLLVRSGMGVRAFRASVLLLGIFFKELDIRDVSIAVFVASCFIQDARLGKTGVSSDSPKDSLGLPMKFLCVLFDKLDLIASRQHPDLLTYSIIFRAVLHCIPTSGDLQGFPSRESLQKAASWSLLGFSNLLSGGLGESDEKLCRSCLETWSALCERKFDLQEVDGKEMARCLDLLSSTIAKEDMNGMVIRISESFFRKATK